MHWYLRKLYSRYGPVIKFETPQKTVVLCFKPEDIETVHRVSGAHPNRKGIFQSMHYYRTVTRKNTYKSAGMILE